MSITLELRPELETKVKAQAEARGLPVERYLQSVIEAAALSPSAPPLTLEEQERLLDELENGLSHVPALPEDAFSRAGIYVEHD
jgi:hypothetical protein